MATRCTATRQDGHPCKAWARADTDPPRCAAHDPATPSPGAPTGNVNAVRHGFYQRPPTAAPPTIDEIITDLAAKQARLSTLIELELQEDSGRIDNLAKLFALHGQNASRLGRLLRDRRALSGEAADGIAGAIAVALDELSNAFGIEL